MNLGGHTKERRKERRKEGRKGGREEGREIEGGRKRERERERKKETNYVLSTQGNISNAKELQVDKRTWICQKHWDESKKPDT